MKGPDFENKRVITPQGYSIPTGEAIKYPEPSEEVQAAANAGQTATSFGFRFGPNSQTFYQL